VLGKVFQRNFAVEGADGSYVQWRAMAFKMEKEGVTKCERITVAKVCHSQSLVRDEKLLEAARHTNRERLTVAGASDWLSIAMIASVVCGAAHTRKVYFAPVPFWYLARFRSATVLVRITAPR
jgi:hypothetical protein